GRIQRNRLHGRRVGCEPVVFQAGHGDARREAGHQGTVILLVVLRIVVEARTDGDRQPVGDVVVGLGEHRPGPFVQPYLAVGDVLQPRIEGADAWRRVSAPLRQKVPAAAPHSGNAAQVPGNRILVADLAAMHVNLRIAEVGPRDPGKPPAWIGGEAQLLADGLALVLVVVPVRVLRKARYVAHGPIAGQWIAWVQAIARLVDALDTVRRAPDIGPQVASAAARPPGEGMALGRVIDVTRDRLDGKR